jgi:opacity protein-like surface antigen
MNCATCNSEAAIRVSPRGAGTSGARRCLRAGFAALGLLLAARPAAAADFDSLRGSLSSPFNSATYSRWGGVNFGVVLGLTSMDTDFGNSTSGEVAYILRNSTLEDEAQPSSWTALPNDISNSRTYGAFLGYSVQWDELVVGIDLAYNHPSSMLGSSGDSLSRRVTTSDSVQHDVTIAATSTMKLVDYATMRLRAGYAMGQFLPYAFVGGAAGRFNYTSSSTVTSLETPPAPAVPYTYGPFTQSDNKDDAVVGGFTLGLGMDVALLPNVFLRAEWEYVGFAPVNGIRSGINTGRIGLGVKF